ncbi:MAG: hypothetical protein ACP5OR_01440 [Candidatus Dormibacteria bacterium]
MTNNVLHYACCSLVNLPLPLRDPASDGQRKLVWIIKAGEHSAPSGAVTGGLDNMGPFAVETVRSDLAEGRAYRIAYRVGDSIRSHVIRSVAIFDGIHDERLWDGTQAACFFFRLPQGRALTLVEEQIIEVRLIEQNAQGQWILHDTRRRRKPVRPAHVRL